MMLKNTKTFMRKLFSAGGLFGFVLLNLAFAAEDAKKIGLSKIASNVTASLEGVTNLVMNIALAAGLCFVLGGIFKFKQHRDNPTQVPLSGPIWMLGIGLVLIAFPTFLTVSKETIFGGEDIQISSGSLDLKDVFSKQKS